MCRGILFFYAAAQVSRHAQVVFLCLLGLLRLHGLLIGRRTRLLDVLELRRLLHIGLLRLVALRRSRGTRDEKQASAVFLAEACSPLARLRLRRNGLQTFGRIGLPPGLPQVRS